MSSSDRDSETVVTHVPPSGSSPPTSRRTAIPAQLGRYTIRRMLGKGGVGAVYEADDPELGRKVAIKVLREDREGDKEDIRREAQALAKLVHPNVVTVHDVGVAGDDVYLVMQLVSAQTIDGYLAARHPSKDRIVELFRQAGEGLVAAHAAGLVHCDFKPGNVLVDDHGHVRVSDFGLAKVARAADASTSTSALQIAGTPAYMAPEQFAGLATPASDQFAFCVALWEALAGERPFKDTGLEYVERKPPPKHPRVPARFARVLERGMATEEADRYPSMSALLAELRPRHVGRHLAMAVVAAIAIGIASFMLLRNGDSIANVRAEADVDKPIALTKFGTTACAYAPAIEPGGRDVVFDRTEGEAVDLYAVPLAGGAPRQLTSSPLWEWRAQPGRRAGEVVHLVHHPKEADKEPKVAYLDLATGKPELALQRLVWDAIVVGDTLFYAPDLPHGIWRLSPGGESELAKPPEGLRFIMLAGSRHAIAAIGSNTDDGPVKPCIVDIETRAIRCSPTEATPARPAFGADGRTLYFAVDAEIRAWDLTTNTETVIFKGDYPEGGLAITPDGSALVYSNCFARSQIVDAAAGTVLVEDMNATQPTFASTGALAWISIAFRSRVLVVLLPDGTRKQLTNISRESIHTPAFKHDGSAIVFKTAAPNAGIFTVNITSAGETSQLTNNEGDENPFFTADNHIVFTRSDGTGNSRPFIMNLDGAEQRQLGLGASRMAYGARGTDLLVHARVSDALYWMDIATGAERPGPAQPPGQFQYASLSPDGNWVVYQLGANGQSLWRLRLDAPGAKPEQVREYAAGQTVGLPAIDNTGRVLATPATWSGDIFAIRPKPGHRF